ncbi:MAG TPA: hypothetical protein VHA57_03080 [Actinomycetota bacterium]|nr:hypothetical protein [Actinomycetota bacterium]
MSKRRPREYRSEPDRSTVDRMKDVEKEMEEVEEELKKDTDPYHGPDAITEPTRKVTF